MFPDPMAVLFLVTKNTSGCGNMDVGICLRVVIVSQDTVVGMLGFGFPDARFSDVYIIGNLDGRMFELMDVRIF